VGLQFHLACEQVEKVKPLDHSCILVDAVLVGSNPTTPPQCGREPRLSFFDTTLETKTSLGSSPVPKVQPNGNPECRQTQNRHRNIQHKRIPVQTY